VKITEILIARIETHRRVYRTAPASLPILKTELYLLMAEASALSERDSLDLLGSPPVFAGVPLAVIGEGVTS
jgi:hypothetical protein